MGSDDDTPPGKLGARRPGTGYQIGHPPRGREVLAPRAVPQAEDFEGRTPPPTAVGRRRVATPLPVAVAVPEYDEGVPEEVDPQSDISVVSQKVDRAVRRAVATIPPPVARITSVDIARIALGVVGTLVGALVIAFFTRSCKALDDINDRPTRNEVREDIRRAVEPIGQKLDRLLERP